MTVILTGVCRSFESAGHMTDLAKSLLLKISCFRAAKGALCETNKLQMPL